MQGGEGGNRWLQSWWHFNTWNLKHIDLVFFKLLTDSPVNLSSSQNFVNFSICFQIFSDLVFLLLLRMVQFSEVIGLGEEFTGPNLFFVNLGKPNAYPAYISSKLCKFTLYLSIDKKKYTN